METKLEQIRDEQREIWNKYSPCWKKWDTFSMDFMKPVGDEMIRQLKPKHIDLILDVAGGTGEPGLSIADKLCGGQVIVTDLSDGMLEVARDKAAERGIKNMGTIVCHVSELPFAANTFDAVSCRFGFMFFPDMLLAAKEMVRVLKPGGRIVVSVWNSPEKNYWVTNVMSTLNKNMQLPPQPFGAPGIFRCAQSGFMTELFLQAGLRNISETLVSGKLNAVTPEVYWDFMTEVVAPVSSALRKADPAMRLKIKNEVFELLDQKYPDGIIAIDSGALVIYGEK